MRFITLSENSKIISIREAQEIVNGEIESTYGEIGQLMLEDGTFIDDPQDEILRQQSLIEQRKQQLIRLMITANALRDDEAWQIAKTEYDTL